MTSRKKNTATKAAPRIAIIGAGNAATRIGLALKKSGVTVTSVYSKTQSSSKALAKKLEAESVSSISKIGDCDFMLVAVSDRALTKLVAEIKTSAIVMHTSGTTAMDVLKKSSKQYGVFYPLQTLSKEKEIEFSSVTICTEASDKKTLKQIQELASTAGANVLEMNSSQRRYAHLAAVFACNFSNHCYAIAQQILSENKLPENLLQPLIEETAMKLRSLTAAEAQTGPAVRGDENIIKLHRSMLGKNKSRKKIYELMSRDIDSLKQKKWNKTSKKR